MSEKEGFLRAIEKDRYDQTLRLVFADWLEERGLDEEAREQREWTPEWQQSEDWLSQFAKDITEFDCEEVTLAEVVEAGRKYLKAGETSNLSGFGFGATNLLGRGGSRMLEEFWRQWHVYTRTEAVPEQDYYEPFHCCY